MAKKNKRYGFSKKRSAISQFIRWRTQKGGNPPGLKPLGRDYFEVTVGYRNGSDTQIVPKSRRISYRGKGIWSVAR